MRSRNTVGDEPLEAPRPESEPESPETASVEDVATAAEPGEDSELVEASEDTSVAAEPAAAGAEAGSRQASRVGIPEQCLTFTLAGEEYGVGILQIREIVEYETLTRVPQTPSWIRGVMNLRGTVVPVIDLAVKFGLPDTEVTPRTCVVIVEADLEGELTLMGVLVDAVVRVLDLTPGEVEEPPAFGTRVRVEFLLGVARVEDKLVLLLDIDRVLSLDELLAVAAAPAAAAEGEGLDPDDGEAAD